MRKSPKTLVRGVVVALLFILALALAAPALAGVQVVAAEPAVVVPEEAEEAEEDPWTARFLGPAVVVIAVVSVGSAASYYLVRVRGRYRVVQ